MKHIFYAVLLVFFIFVQIGFFSHLTFLKDLNLALCFLTIYFLQRKRLLLIYVILSGVLLDLYSIFPQGFYLVIFLLTFVFLNWLRPRFGDISVLMNIVIAFLTLAFYQIIFIILRFLLYYFGISQWSVIFDGSYFCHLGLFFALNILLIFLVNKLWAIPLKPKHLD